MNKDITEDFKEEWKVFIRGVEGRGNEVIKALTDLGAENNDGCCDTDISCHYIYFINHEGHISSVSINSESAKIIMDNYHELKLPEKWKDGDIIFSPRFETFAVYGYDNPTTVYCRVTKTDIISHLTRVLKKNYRLATPKEIEYFHELLHKYHKEWDANNKRLIDWKWKPKEKERYWYIGITGSLNTSLFVNDVFDNNMYSFGNCFRTKKEAKNTAEKIKKLLNA